MQATRRAPYDRLCQLFGFLFGGGAEFLAKKHNITRKEQDEVALRSQNNAENATKTGRFKDHVELAESLDLIDFEKGTKISGFRGYYLKNEGAMLVMALMLYAFNKMVEKELKKM